MGRLRATLTTADTFSIATGAMFSSGFFLLPGIAAAMTGTSVVLAYFVAAVLMVPAMLCQAELSTAMPRSGGTYFFIDRALGPLLGSVAGFSTWFALVLKTAFALVGLGAYVVAFTNVSPLLVALSGGALFVLLNLKGADHSAAAQRWLVGALLVALLAFLAAGGAAAIGVGAALPADGTLTTTAFLTSGWDGFAATVGLVAVSYAGLTKVASVAGEIAHPDRALPWGMLSALLVTTVVYVLGVAIVLAAVPAADLFGDTAPLATAAAVVFPGQLQTIGVAVISIAALASFISTANAGVLAAARYPFAMARDALLPARFGVAVGGTPRAAVLLTGALVLGCVFLDVASMAKLASAVQMVLFMLLAVSVIVMRESRIVSYTPGFRSPFYPWVQLMCIAASIGLIFAMGLKAIAFASVVFVASALVYALHARHRIERRGALPHLFARLGRERCPAIDRELGQLLVERAERKVCYRHEHVARVRVRPNGPLAEILDHPHGYLALPAEVEVVTVDREGQRFDPVQVRPRPDDEVTLVGAPEALSRLVPANLRLAL
jgi:amino acid transporter